MNALKILNIALLALIISMFITLISPKPSNIAQNTVSIVAQEDLVSIPNIPSIVVHNNTQNAVSIDTCQNITLTQNSNNVVISSVAPDFCKTEEIAAGDQKKLDMEKLHKLFASTPAKYVMMVDVSGEQKVVTFQTEKPGFFKSLLTELIYNPIYNLFAGLILVLPGHSLGWAIVIVTIIIRLILLYPQHRMLENTRKMAELNPKIRALQKEYGNDRATLGMKMMELYKKENVSPMGSCLPLLIQFPILIGLYWVIMGITNVSNTYHLYSFLSDFNPANIAQFFFGQDLLATGGITAVVLAILLAATQWLQGWLSIKVQPPLPEVEKTEENSMPTLDPRLMHKMTLYVFPVLIGASALFFPIGLGLYWWIGLLFMIVQQLFVNARAEKKKKKGEIIKKK